jgi:hypothetical protein
MSIESLNFAEPFFSVNYLKSEKEFTISGKSIALNLSQTPLMINGLPLGFFQSTILMNTQIFNIERCILIGDIEAHSNQDKLFELIKNNWTLAYDATHEDRHKGIALWRSTKIHLNDVAINMCYADSIPLNVGLHKTHWGGPPIKEVHTQIVGIGKMQQFYEQNRSTLYREELMAPGCSHIPMFDNQCQYPWHQYETVTKGIFMATEMLVM